MLLVQNKKFWILLTKCTQTNPLDSCLEVVSPQNEWGGRIKVIKARVRWAWWIAYGKRTKAVGPITCQTRRASATARSYRATIINHSALNCLLWPQGAEERPTVWNCIFFLSLVCPMKPANSPMFLTACKVAMPAQCALSWPEQKSWHACSFLPRALMSVLAGKEGGLCRVLEHASNMHRHSEIYVSSWT